MMLFIEANAPTKAEYAAILPTSNEFRVGDFVWCQRFDYGKVLKVNKVSTFLFLEVDFEVYGRMEIMTKGLGLWLVRREVDEFYPLEKKHDWQEPELRQVEERHKAKEARKENAAREETRKAEEARKAEEKRKAEEERKEAERRRADERRKAEQKQKEEEARKAAEANKAYEKAMKEAEAKRAAIEAEKKAREKKNGIIFIVVFIALAILGGIISALTDGNFFFGFVITIILNIIIFFIGSRF